MLTAKLIEDRLMEGDLGVVNAARVSFNKRHDVIDVDKDGRLINFLARHRHWSPFAHPQLVMKTYMNVIRLGNWAIHRPAGLRLVRADGSGTFFISGSLFGFIENLSLFSPEEAQVVKSYVRRNFPLSAEAFGVSEPENTRLAPMCFLDEEAAARAAPGEADQLLTATFLISAPIFVARQLGKHQVDLVWNEISRRYVDFEPEFWTPEQWRERPDGSVKQGSSDKTVSRWVEQFDMLLDPVECNIDYDEIIDVCKAQYNHLLDLNVAPEMARAVLPQSMETQWYWTGSLSAFARVCHERMAPEAQEETRVVAEQINQALTTQFGNFWKWAKEKEAIRVL